MLILQLILKILFQISRIRKYKKKTSRLFNLLAFFINGTVLAPLTALSLLHRRKKAPKENLGSLEFIAYLNNQL